MTELAQRRDEAMNRRRLELGMTWRQVAAAAGISYETLRSVRKGDTAGGELTLSSIERALGWTRGSFAAIDAGGQPGLGDSAAEPPQAATTRQPPSLEQELELAARLMAAQIRELGLSPDEAEEAWERARARIVSTHGAGSTREREDGMEGPRGRRSAG